MKTIEDLIQEFNGYIVDEKIIRNPEDLNSYVEGEIVDIVDEWHEIESARRTNDSSLKMIKFKQKFPKIFKPEDGFRFEQDNRILLEIGELIINNLEHFERIRNAINEDNYLELAKLSALLGKYFDSNMEILVNRRDLLGITKLTNVLHNSEIVDTRKIVDDFANEKISVFEDKNKEYVKSIITKK